MMSGRQKTTMGQGIGAGEQPPTVRMLAWPHQRGLLETMREAGGPLLFVVDDDHEPPPTKDCCEDWMWRSGGARELRLRIHQLSLNALRHGHGIAVLDEYGTLRLGLRTVQLPPKERLIMRHLLARFGQPFSREELARAVWPAGVSGPNVIASRISMLRGRLRWLDLEIATSAGAYVLRTSPAVAHRECGGDEDAIEVH